MEDADLSSSNVEWDVILKPFRDRESFLLLSSLSSRQSRKFFIKVLLHDHSSCSPRDVIITIISNVEFRNMKGSGGWKCSWDRMGEGQSVSTSHPYLQAETAHPSLSQAKFI